MTKQPSNRKPGEWHQQMGQRLRQWRRRAGLSQARVAKVLGVSYQMVQKYEKGQARLPAHALEPLARLYGTTAQNLLPPPSNV